MKNDTEYKEHVIDAIKSDDALNMWDICVDKSAYMLIPKHATFIPKVGMKAKFYGRGFGYPVRGVVIEDTVMFYRTKEEEETKHKNWVQNKIKEDKARFEKNKDAMDKRFNALPEVFQKRIQRFRDNNSDFRWEYEDYELFTCEEAVKIANALKTEEAIVKWKDMDWEDQKKLVDIDDGHSGNTFGCAVMLAQFYITRPEFVVKSHGAMVGVVGCEEYGCKH